MAELSVVHLVSRCQQALTEVRWLAGKLAQAHAGSSDLPWRERYVSSLP